MSLPNLKFIIVHVINVIPKTTDLTRRTYNDLNKERSEYIAHLQRINTEVKLFNEFDQLCAMKNKKPHIKYNDDEEEEDDNDSDNQDMNVTKNLEKHFNVTNLPDFDYKRDFGIEREYDSPNLKSITHRFMVGNTVNYGITNFKYIIDHTNKQLHPKIMKESLDRYKLYNNYDGPALCFMNARVSSHEFENTNEVFTIEHQVDLDNFLVYASTFKSNSVDLLVFVKPEQKTTPLTNQINQ